MTKKIIFDKMNELYNKKIPFFFIVDYEKTAGEVIPLSELEQYGIYYSTPGQSNIDFQARHAEPLLWRVFPVSKQDYRPQFNKVMQEIKSGNTYLLNLTCAAKVETNYTLEELFYAGNAKYKLYYKDHFIHFSPEPFVVTAQDRICSYPMKGTIDAALEHAEEHIINDTKELNEQFTIVDLIRNDLSMVAANVRVDKFRYIEKITTNNKTLLSVSSKISGTLREEYRHKPGDLFDKLLPAGSICGAPKQKTIEIIANTETHRRGFYTGVWGIFDGEKIDSCVIIRYLQRENNNLIFKSGGGITCNSRLQAEYQEMIDKIYVPVY